MRINRQGGFSLIEVVFAGVVLAISSVGLAAGMAQGDHLTRGVQHEMRARNAVRGMMAEISATPFDQCASLFNDTAFEVEGLDAAKGDPDDKPGKVTFEYGPGGDTNMYRVSVEVTWRDGSGERTVRSVCFVSNVRGDTGTPPPLPGQ